MILDEETYAKLRRYQLALEVDMDKDKIFCPNTDCNTVLSLKETKKLSVGKTWQCKECKVEICKKC